MMRPRTMNRLIILVLSTILLTIVSCSDEQSETMTAVLERTVAVKGLILHTSDRQVTKSYTGSLQGEQQAVIRARLSEAVREVHVTEGDEIKASTIVVSLDRYGPSSNYTQTNAVYLNAKKNHEQLKFLFDEGAVSESRFDAARTEYKVAEAELAAVTRRIDIESPIAGRVTSVDVSPGDITQVGQAVVTVASTDRLRVKFVVNADYVKTLKAGAEVLISSDAVGATATGTITTVSTSANKDSRSFPVEALMDNSGGLFHPGMYVHVDYIIDRLAGVLVVPREAVLNIDGQPTVFKSVGGRAVMTSVTLGAVLQGDVIVLAGIGAFDTLITIGQEYLEDGLLLNMTELQEQTK